MYLNNFSKFSEVDDRYASFNTSKKNVKENFTNLSDVYIIKTEGLCRRSNDINDYGGYCVKNSGVTEGQCINHCNDTLGCVAAGHYLNDNCDLFFHNKRKPVCPDGFNSYEGTSTKTDDYFGIYGKYGGQKTVCTELKSNVLKTRGLCRRSEDINNYGGYCVKNSGVTEEQCTNHCKDTPGCVAAGHYLDDNCELFFQNKATPENCPSGFNSYEGTSTSTDEFEGLGSNYGNKRTVCTNLKNNVLQTKGLCRRPGDDYGGYCVKNSGVTEKQCNIHCKNTTGCVAAGHYSGDQCDLFFNNKEKPENCPSGFISYEGLSDNIDDAYEGTGKNHGTNRTMCTTNFNRIDLSKALKFVNEDRKKKITEYKNKPNKNCNDCKTVMTILEPTIIIVYKLWVEREGISDIIGALVSSFILGTGQKMAEKELENSGAVSDLKLLDEGANNNGLIQKLNIAIEKSLGCLAKGAGKTVLELRKFNAKNLNKIIKKGLHSFLRCLLTMFTRLVIMEITGCTDYDSCDIKTDFAKIFSEGMKKIVKTINDSNVEMAKLDAEANSGIENRECVFDYQCSTGKCNFSTGKCIHKSEDEPCEHGNQCGDGLSCLNGHCTKLTVSKLKSFGDYCGGKNHECATGVCATNNLCTGSGEYANGAGKWCEFHHNCTSGYCWPWQVCL